MGKVSDFKVKRKISTKIMISILLVNIISMAAFGGIVLFLLDGRVGKEASTMATTQVEATVNAFEQDFSNIENATSILVNEIIAEVDLSKAKSDKAYLQDYKKELVERLAVVGEKTDLTKSIYVYFNVEMFDQEVDIWMLEQADGSFVLQDSFGKEYYDDYYAWYHEPIDNHVALWTDPYESADGSNVITSYVTPVMVGNEAIALVGMDLYLDDIRDKLNEVTVFDTGYLYMINPDGTVYVHKGLDFGTSVLDAGEFDNILKAMNEHNSGYEIFETKEGVKSITAYSHLGNGWIVASAIPEHEVMKVVKSIINIIVGMLLVSVIVAIIVSLVIGKSITKPINDLVIATEQIKTGDFTTQVDVKAQDETALLANGLNAMTEAVKELILEAKNVSMDMVESASDLAAMSEETNATVDQVATTVQEITKGTQDTAKDAEVGAEIASKIQEQFDVLMDNSNAMTENANVAIEVNKKGLEALDELRVKSEESNKSTNKVNDAVVKLNENTNAITDIISTITSIAEQTNLLALNASIEAARAGEAGRGFAVVAEEIRKLAESSGDAAEEIRNIISAINQDTEDTVQVMTEMSKLSDEQNESLDNVNSSFTQIFNTVESISKQIETVTGELTVLNESKGELIEAVSNISAISEETAAATQEVEVSMDEQTTAVEQVARSAEKLNSLSTELNKKIEYFKV